MELIASSFFNVLGWETSSEKGGSLDAVAKALGVVIDLSFSKLWQVTVNNTESRGKEIMDFIQGSLTAVFSGMVNLRPSEDVFFWPKVRCFEGPMLLLFASVDNMLTECLVARSTLN